LVSLYVMSDVPPPIVKKVTWALDVVDYTMNKNSKTSYHRQPDCDDASSSFNPYEGGPALPADGPAKCPTGQLLPKYKRHNLCEHCKKCHLCPAGTTTYVAICDAAFRAEMDEELDDEYLYNEQEEMEKANGRSKAGRVGTFGTDVFYNYEVIIYMAKEKIKIRQPTNVIVVTKKHLNSDNASNGKLSLKAEYGRMSGSEPAYEPSKWNSKAEFKDNHNCYSYAINEIMKHDGKPQPGYFSGFPPMEDDEYNCDEFARRMKKELPSMYKQTFEKPCNKGFHKAFLAIDNSGNNDYHFYRQDNNGYWSHKPGATDATDVDASGNKIINPTIADRKYPHYNYSVPCFYFCVNPRMATIVSSANLEMLGGDDGLTYT
jgi:hypothetical protein